MSSSIHTLPVLHLSFLVLIANQILLLRSFSSAERLCVGRARAPHIFQQPLLASRRSGAAAQRPAGNRPELFRGDGETQPAVSLLLVLLTRSRGTTLCLGLQHPNAAASPSDSNTQPCSGHPLFFRAFPSTTSLHENCRKRTSAKMFYFHLWPA